ncbi:IclR family transcriptional regulator [Sneathiella sp.]|jgi:DNA-binding IclR family transcriptional regulator|uniref:IclR family transcriptional regulator n=1 Tax=Sneathiella sp. TaxID=1964365 RepID=UPI0039E615C0
MENNNTKKGVKPVGAAKLTIDILRALSNRRGGIGVTPLAVQLDRYPGTVYAVLKTLQQEGMVEFNAATKTYSLCLGGILELTGKMREEQLAKRIEPEMKSAADQFGVCLYLSQHVRQDYMVIVACALPDLPMGLYAKVGTRFPARYGGAGRLLAGWQSLDPDDLHRAYDKHRWAGTQPAFEEWAEQVRQDRMAGFAYEEETLPEGLATVVAPISVDGKPVKYIINAIGPRGDIAHGKLPEIVEMVKKLAQIAAEKS